MCRKIGGSGMGLAIIQADAVAHRHDGQLRNVLMLGHDAQTRGDV
jgi:hypothetical protein